MFERIATIGRPAFEAAGSDQVFARRENLLVDSE
jgi:hypothetical protein